MNRFQVTGGDSDPLLREVPSAGVNLGEGTVIDRPAYVGLQPRDPAGHSPTSIGRDGRVRAFGAIYAGVTIGDRFQSGHGVMIREDNVLGDDVSVGTHTVLEPGNRIGDRVRIHTGCFLELVTVEDDVFIGPGVVFTDDPHPPCPRYEECRRGATVRRGARIGANATLLPGVDVGAGALIGAGTVVVDDVPPEKVVVGNPGRVLCDIDDLDCETGLFDKPYQWERAGSDGR